MNIILGTPPIKKFCLPFEWILVNGKKSEEIRHFESSSSNREEAECQKYKDYYMKSKDKDFFTYIASLEQTPDPSLYFAVIRDEIFQTLKETPKSMELLLTRLVLSILSIAKNQHTLPSFYVDFTVCRLSIESIFPSTSLFHSLFKANRRRIERSGAPFTQTSLPLYPHDLFLVRLNENHHF